MHYVKHKVLYNSHNNQQHSCTHEILANDARSPGTNQCEVCPHYGKFLRETA